MLTVQYTGKGERTIGTQVVYPGELLHASPNQLAAWQAEHGDVFVLVAGAKPPTAEPPTAEPPTAEPIAEPEPVEPKAKRK